MTGQDYFQAEASGSLLFQNSLWLVPTQLAPTALIPVNAPPADSADYRACGEMCWIQ